MTVAKTIYKVLAEAIVIIIIIQVYQEKPWSISFFALGLEMAFALDISMAIAMTTASSLL